jgi:AcrR family transcriptional regulator
MAMGRPARIDRDAVLDAALALADARGLDAVTMAAVAAQLDVTPMALYRHIGRKADLLDGLVERLLDELPSTTAAGRGDPAGELARLGEAVRATARRHPAVFPLLLQRPATTPGALRARDAVCEALRRVGVPDTRVARCERLISTAVLGFAASEAGGRFRNHPRAVVDDDFARLLELLASLVETEATPA